MKVLANQFFEKAVYLEIPSSISVLQKQAGHRVTILE
jgi:hypothetical protein